MKEHLRSAKIFIRAGKGKPGNVRSWRSMSSPVSFLAVVHCLRTLSGLWCKTELRQIRPLPIYRSIPILIRRTTRLARSQAVSSGARPACPS
jgi:hypothetical protein